MTTLTMTWNDCHCAGISDHYRHTMEFEESRDVLKAQGDWEVTKRIISDYYALNADDMLLEGETAADLAKSALQDIGMVGIFIGIPEEL